MQAFRNSVKEWGEIPASLGWNGSGDFLYRVVGT